MVSTAQLKFQMLTIDFEDFICICILHLVYVKGK
jgi:hypothetical protein